MVACFMQLSSCHNIARQVYVEYMQTATAWQHCGVSTQMQAKLSDFRAENALLGQLVKDCKVTSAAGYSHAHA